MAEQQADWIEWAGGECPVAPDTELSIRFRDAFDIEQVRASFHIHQMRQFWRHTSEDRRCDIIAYRVVPA